MKEINVLYITYNGLLSHLGQSQILPYIRELKNKGNVFFVISFEKEDHKPKSGFDYIRYWKFLRYTYRFGVVSKIYDIFCGLFWGFFLCIKNEIKIIHCRSYLPTLIGLIIKMLLFHKSIKVVFDMRGFLPDEYADIGHWDKKKPIYKIVKFFEKRLLFYSDHIVILTHAGKNYLEKKYNLKKITTIPCCVDELRFKRTAHSVDVSKKDLRKILFKKFENNLIEKKIFIYIGSVGTWYPLDKMIEFFKVIKTNEEKNSFFLLLVNDLEEKVTTLMSEYGVSPQDFAVMRVSGHEVMSYIQAVDYGIAFIKNIFSKIASSPIKNGEFIFAKIPIVCNDIGDNTFLISKDIGYVIKNFDELEYINGFNHIRRIDPNSYEYTKSREFVLQKHLGLSEGVKRYHHIYEKVIAC
ncbi:MAG: glycosyltransferase [Oligoflexia bacterium]|nr:glycosyltransferase [Oligoflexia bacterium]